MERLRFIKEMPAYWSVGGRLLRGLKSWKLQGEQFEAVATVILRVPGYFILDYWYQNDLLNCIPRSLEWPDVVSAGFVIFAVIQGILVLLLPLEQLVALYMHYLTVAVLAAADTFSRYYVETEKKLVEEVADYDKVNFQGFSNMLMLQKSLFDPEDDIGTIFLRRQVAAIVFHILVATSVTFFLDLEATKDKIPILVYLIPVFGRLAGCPIEDLHLTHNFSSCFVIFLTVQYIFLCIPHVFRFIKVLNKSVFRMLQWYGPWGLITKLWRWLFIPVQLLIFWLMLFVTQIYSHLIQESYSRKANDSFEDTGVGRSALENSFAGIKILVTNMDDVISSNVNEDSIEQTKDLIGNMWYLLVVQSVAEVCYTPMMLAGLCVTFSYFSSWVLKATKYIAAGRSAHPGAIDYVDTGWTEGVTLAFLALQTSLLSIPMPERMAVLCILFLIVISSLLQSMFELVEPLVLALSTQGLASFHKHVRMWMILLFLLISPLYMVHTFTLIFDQEFWLLLVASASIMTSVQVFGLIVIYILLTWDAISAQPWPILDDLIYYTKGTTRVFEFLVAVFIVGAGIKESVSGNWSWINSAVLMIHFYFNVWQRLQQGWRSFLLRMEAAVKISHLPKATDEELKAYDDLCAICYSDMESACVTNCKHIFHPACLRKWLYVQDKCPMCHSQITIAAKKEEDVLDSSPSAASARSLEPDIEAEAGNTIPYSEETDEDQIQAFEPLPTDVDA